MAKKAKALYDDFDTGALSALWSTFLSGSSTATVSGTSVVLANVATTVGTAQLNSASTYDLMDSYFRCKITGVPGDTNVDAAIGIRLDASNILQMVIEGTTIFADTIIATVETGHNGRTYSAITDLWIQIRESKGVTYFETSPDAIDWKVLYSVATPFAVNNVALFIAAVEYASTATPGSLTIDKANTPPFSIVRRNVRPRPFAP